VPRAALPARPEAPVTRERVQRWEDVARLWRGPSYRDAALRYHASVAEAPIGGPLMAGVDVVDWDGDGGRDLLVSGWDACYGTEVRVYEQIGVHEDGTPRLGEGQVVEGVSGFVAAVPDAGRFHLLSTSRLRAELWLYRDEAESGPPRFGAPLVIPLEADWLHAGDGEDEVLHVSRFADVDGDGRLELLVGTDYWGDYWPEGVEWFEEGYRPYDSARRWRGGPLRGHVYVFENRGSLAEPELGRGVPLRAGDAPLDVYGMPAVTVGDVAGRGAADLVCGDFLFHLHYLAARGAGRFDAPRRVSAPTGHALELPHCIYIPTAADWDGDGRCDLLVGEEGGRVQFLRNAGAGPEGVPSFAGPSLVLGTGRVVHCGSLPVPAACDWNGDGRLDLVVGNSEGELLFFPNLGEPGRPELGSGVRLRAEGKRIRIDAPGGSLQGPSELRFGYSCPTVVDWDLDGRPDVLMSDVHGRHLFLRNAGGYPPELEAPVPLLFEGKPLETVWRVRPSVARWGSDTRLSYVCLDAEGVLSAYTRESAGSLGEKRQLLFEDGTPVRFTEDFGGGRGRIKLCVCPWTGDGRHHLIFGTHNRASVPPGSGGAPRHTTGEAGVFLMENVGTDAAPRFGAPRALHHRGEPIRLGMHSCAPEAVRWTGKGDPDLLVGAEDGTLLWLRREDLSW